jgi:hypothetical protein
VGEKVALSMAAKPVFQDFWLKLRELRANEADLPVVECRGSKYQVIKLEGGLQFPGQGGVTHVLRRESYQVAHRQIKSIWAAPDPKKLVIISGTPGKFVVLRHDCGIIFTSAPR